MRATVPDGDDNTPWRWKAVDVAVRLAMPILLGVSAWAGLAITDHDKRIGVIEATRYTKDDRAKDVERRAAERAAERRDQEMQRVALLAALGEIRVILARVDEGSKSALDRLNKIEVKLESRPR